MSLTDYMSYIGGLFGLWFGTNGKDFVIWIIESRFWVWVYTRYQQMFPNNRIHVITN